MTTTQGTLIPCPYIVGAGFRICFSPPAGSPSELHVTVVDSYTPFTISPVMRVSLDSVMSLTSDNAHPAAVGLPSEMVLKVYDRRFALSLREHYSGKPATHESEALYRQYLASGPAVDFEALDEDITAVLPTGGYEGCPSQLFERLITFAMDPYFESECAAYRRLASLQGRDIPAFYGTTRFLDGLSVPDLDPPVQGVLLEVVPGVSLDRVNPASVNIDSAVRDAMRIVGSYCGLGVLNRDVHLGNFVVKPGGSVVMIDFAQSRLREEGESDQDWKDAKHGADEENCIGFEAARKFNWPWARGHEYADRSISGF